MIYREPAEGAKSNALREYNALGEIRTEILNYFDEHPDACDCAEAIQQWWILQRVYRYSLAKVREALDQLVHENLVERRCIGGEYEVFARPRGNRADCGTTGRHGGMR